jgi:NAD(P)-dependent dehydrogenase (short-subunit alcohol dehydrogenase family)
VGGDLVGRVALVTGVGRAGQIGHALARALGEAGARLVVAGRSAAALEERLQELAAAGIEAAPSAGDLTDAGTAGAAVSVAESRFGGLDIVVNAAGGLTTYGPFLDAPANALARELAANLHTVFTVCQAAIPVLRRGGGGAIVNFTSGAVLRPQPNLAAYAAAKGGVATLTRVLAREFRDDRIRVNALAMDAVRTASNEASMGSDARFVELADVTRTVQWLVSEDAAAVTGQILPLLAGAA